MEKSDFVIDVEELMATLKEIAEKLDVSHISTEGMGDSPEVGIPFNKALSYIEAAEELVNQAQKNLNLAIKASHTVESKSSA
jgi:6-pyruvoyl-tetrahydropterin synthase